jgi:hypothetical protein
VDSEVTEEALFDLLQRNGITTTAMVLKRGYAFVDCPDSNIFQTAIDQLNGRHTHDLFPLLGSLYKFSFNHKSNFSLGV